MASLNATAGTPQTLKHIDAISNRTFGIFAGTVLLVMGTWPLFLNRPGRPWVVGVALVLISLGTLSPRLLYWPKFVWLSITHRIGQIVQFALMVVMFFGVITPVALFFKLIGRDTLHRRFDKNAASYWLSRTGSSDMKQQF